MAKIVEDEVWAKSDETSLHKHIQDCLKVFVELKETLPALPQVVCLANFWELLFFATYLHDLGKCHREFQKLLKEQPHFWCRQRHEAYSIPFIEKLTLTDQQKLLLKRAILAHHKTLDKLIHKIKSDNKLKMEFNNEWGHKKGYRRHFHPEDFIENLRHNINSHYIQFIFETLRQDYSRYINTNSSLKLNPINIRHSQHPYQEIAKSTHQREFLPEQKEYWQNLLLWGALKICDHYGSANIKALYSLNQKSFVFLDKLQKQLKKSGKNFYDHQLNCFQTKGNCILIAPTGSGKTEAALGWLRYQLSQRQGRAFYILPYIASINAMHQRLTKNFSSDASSMHSNYVGIQHGKLSQYLATYYEETAYTTSQTIHKNQVLKKLREQHRKMIYPLKIVTPFQILKYCYGVKGFEMGFTELAGSYLIFDEIHAYDEVTFAQIITTLKHFIQYLDCKILLMTATLPSFMLKQIMDTLEVQAPVRAERKLLKCFNRHRVILKEGNIFQQLEDIKIFLKKDQRIIIVCNTVINAQKIFQEIKSYKLIPEQYICLLHSRFNSEDRFKKEIAALDRKTKILIGTQAIEVSLDIDYDIMFSEPAPLDALLQRFGRINRKRRKEICPVFICRCGGDSDRYIYPTEVVERTLKVLERIDIIEEENLQTWLDEVYPDWLLEQQQKFQDTQIGFKQSLNSLSPYSSHKELEEDFYDKFDGIQVLPACFFRKYKKMIEHYDFIEADKLLVSIQKGMYWKLKENNLMTAEYFCTEKPIDTEKPNEDITTHKIILANCKYSSDVGLTDEADNSIDIDEQFG